MKRSTFCRPSTPASQNCCIQAGKKCSATIQKTRKRFVHCKRERLLSSATGNLWLKPSPAIRPFKFPSDRKSSADLVCEKHEKAELYASLFASNVALSNFPTSASSSLTIFLFLPCISTKKIRQALRFLNASKPPVRTILHLAS